MTSSAPHWHLILNHFPTVGTVIGLGLLLGSLYLGSQDLELAALVLLVVLGLVAIPTYVTGAAAAFALEGETELPMVTYCTGCRNALRDAGRDTIHVLDLLMTADPMAGARDPEPGTVMRLANRFRAKWAIRRTPPPVGG